MAGFDEGEELMTSLQLAKACPQVRVFGRMLIDYSDEALAFRQAISAFLREHDISLSRLSVASGSSASGGAKIASFIHGTIRMAPSRAFAIADAMDRFPSGWPMPRAADRGRRLEFNQVDGPPLYVLEEARIAALREQAAHARADWIEQQRQAEIARYGFTTIAGDVMEMVA
jgi:hypothetical protein